MGNDEKQKEEKGTDQLNSSETGYSHLKWPAIIIVILIFILIVVLDYFSRTGNL